MNFRYSNDQMFCVEQVSISAGQRLRAALSVVTQDTGTMVPSARCAAAQCCLQRARGTTRPHQQVTAAIEIETKVFRSKVPEDFTITEKTTLTLMLAAAQQAPDKLIHY